MTKIEQLQAALKKVDERDMYWECVEVLRNVLPDLVEAVRIVEAAATINPYGDRPNAAVRDRAVAFMENLK